MTPQLLLLLLLLQYYNLRLSITISIIILQMRNLPLKREMHTIVRVGGVSIFATLTRPSTENGCENVDE